MAMSRTQIWKNSMEEEEMEEEEEEEEDEEEEGGEVGFAEDDRKRRAVSGRSGGAGRSTLPCCQADDCNADLTHARPYHRRHKVCEFHAKAPVVLLIGLEQRFCQQCSSSAWRGCTITGFMWFQSSMRLREAAGGVWQDTTNGGEKAYLTFMGKPLPDKEMALRTSEAAGIILKGEEVK